jgi:lipopolysaccharide/colanic/teichoic acid biosynthesis glycosyltransferase
MDTTALIKRTKQPFARKVKKDTFAEVKTISLQDTANLEALVEELVGKEALDFIEEYVNFSDGSTLVEATATRFNIQKVPKAHFTNIVNLKRVNDIRWINKFFETVNEKIANESIFIGFVETKKNRKKRILNKLPVPFNWVHYTGDFIMHRALPKMKFSKKIYFYITKGHNRVLTKAETLGRLVSCGFEIEDVKEIGKVTWFVTRKTGKPAYDPNPSYGPLFKMRRVGKNGKIIQVYKFRTMHPYAEYLQDYVLRINGYSEIGKPADDFRMTNWGKFMRKYWLDELPQLINVLKGEMKLVGIRPLSKRFLAEYPEDVLQMRLKHKPGCVPPYVALLKQDVEEYIESERIYLLEKEKHPYSTDIKYFFKAVYNILTNKIRSA